MLTDKLVELEIVETDLHETERCAYREQPLKLQIKPKNRLPNRQATQLTQPKSTKEL